MRADLGANLEAVKPRIVAAAQRAGRKAETVNLVAVTKTHPLETVTAAYQAGIRHFGENRAQEFVDKTAGFSAWLEEIAGDEPAQWHFIGHLQSRQVGLVLAGQPDLIHSVDSLKLARRIDRLAERDDIPTVEILLQCNVSGEETKSGFALNRWAVEQGQLDRFFDAAQQISRLDRVSIRGLMTMAPIAFDPEAARPVFRSLAALREKLYVELEAIDWQHLSMGMTDDFEIAIEEGATIIRVGRAIFGERGCNV